METNACNLVTLTTDPSSTCDTLTHGLKVLGEGSMKAGLFRFGESYYQEGYGNGFYDGVVYGVEAGRYEGIGIALGFVGAAFALYGAYKLISGKVAAKKLADSASSQLERTLETLDNPGKTTPEPDIQTEIKNDEKGDIEE